MINENELVSAVITTHNRPELVKKAITSVYSQNYPDIELIVVDDASEKGKEELMHLSHKMGFKYIYIPKDESRGGNHARNRGLWEAKGEFIAYLDDDDEWFENKIGRQVEFLKKHSDVGMVSCGRVIEFDEKERVGDINTTSFEGNLRESIWYDIFATTSQIMFRRQLLIETGGFDEELKYWQEYELLIRMLQITSIQTIAEALMLYRVNRNDSGRLTNKIDGWYSSVRYLERKHSKVFRRLPQEVQNKHLAMVFDEGMRRSYQSNNFSYKRKLLWVLFRKNRDVKSFIKWMINQEHPNDVIKRIVHKL